MGDRIMGQYCQRHRPEPPPRAGPNEIYGLTRLAQPQRRPAKWRKSQGGAIWLNGEHAAPYEFGSSGATRPMRETGNSLRVFYSELRSSECDRLGTLEGPTSKRRQDHPRQ